MRITDPIQTTGNLLSRRQFLKRTIAVSGIFAVPYIIPASALGKGGAVAPSERILMASIGAGGRGSSDLSWMIGEQDIQFIAVCEARKDRRDRAKNIVDEKYGNKDCVAYRDFREMYSERKDIDAVLIATGDRWHALLATLAMKAGKDVYCEKPGSMTIAEGQMLVATAKRYGRIFQTGTQRLSQANFVFAAEMARTGRLGKLHTLRAHTAGGSSYTSKTWLPAEPEPPKDEMDWDMWLGPCPWRPYNSRYTHGGWHGCYDFHTGCIGEWGSHTITQCLMAIPDHYNNVLEFEFPNNDSGSGLVISYPGDLKMMLDATGWRGSCGNKVEGSEGWISVADGYERPEVSDLSLLKDFDKIVQDYMIANDRPMNHVRDFFNCVRNRRPTVSNPGMMHRSMSMVHAANICMWLKRNVKWDPVKQEFIGDPEANRLCSRAMREPWRA
ncbi:MAG: Gfo/Idh/MocA family oxidoreductase [Kiritimatiellae bacterium]|nr:Gfo/Idh/MocA family oxidoreductase [Kiritimatiellia bacterium]